MDLILDSIYFIANSALDVLPIVIFLFAFQQLSRLGIKFQFPDDSLGVEDLDLINILPMFTLKFHLQHTARLILLRVFQYYFQWQNFTGFT